MPNSAPSLEYRLEVIDGYMRPVFEGKGREWNELMWDLLLPFPALAAAMLHEVQSVRDGESEGWEKETPETRITCDPNTLTLEEKPRVDGGREPLKIELPLREALTLIWNWVFECVWRGQQ